MYNDDYVNSFGSSGETPPEDNSADTAQQSAPLEPDQIYSAPQQPEQGSYNSQNSYNSGSYTPPQPEKEEKDEREEERRCGFRRNPRSCYRGLRDSYRARKEK